MKFRLKTYGCQMNVRDTESVAAQLLAHGHEEAASETEADLVIVNSCSVRGKAEDKAIGKLGLLCHSKRERPERIVGVMGCMVQRRGTELFRTLPALDFAVGTQRQAEIARLVERVAAGEGPLLETDEDDERRDILTGHLPGTSSAFVTVLLGCDRRCSYCIVPDVRGHEWSRAGMDVVEEVRQLVDEGVREVTLLGQSVMRYGLRNAAWPEHYASPGGYSEPFTRLLEAVSTVPGLARIRFTSGHPSGCTPELARAMRELAPVCHQLHLPVQAGSDRILKAMRRGYTRQAYLDAVTALREAIPDIALSTDIIVGFPSETEADFEQTRSLMDAVDFDNAFIFKYSPRPGTPAAEWEDDVPDDEKMRRNQVLLEDQDRRSLARNQAQVGHTVEVLCEGPSRRNPRRWSGRTPANRIVVFEPGHDLKAGDLIRVHIERAMPQTLYGSCIDDTPVA